MATRQVFKKRKRTVSFEEPPLQAVVYDSEEDARDIDDDYISDENSSMCSISPSDHDTESEVGSVMDTDDGSGYIISRDGSKWQEKEDITDTLVMNSPDDYVPSLTAVSMNCSTALGRLYSIIVDSA